MEQMKAGIEEVKAERKEADRREHDYRMNQKPITHFPYTHGDTVEAARAQIREEMAQDLKNRCAVLESKEREKIGTELYDQLHGLNNEAVPPGLEKEIHMYP